MESMLTRQSQSAGRRRWALLAPLILITLPLLAGLIASCGTKTGKVNPMDKAEQKLASSPDDDTTAILLRENFWPAGKVRQENGNWYTVFVKCQPQPSRDVRDKCIKDTGSGTFELPRIERQQTGPRFMAYAPPPVNGVIQPGARLFKLYANNVTCTTTQPPRRGQVLSMLTVGQANKGEPGRHYGPDEKAFYCDVT
jgi:hypothetical protein